MSHCSQGKNNGKFGFLSGMHGIRTASDAARSCVFMQLKQNLLDYCQQLIVSASFGVSRLRLQLQAVHTVSRNLNTPMSVQKISFSNILIFRIICNRDSINAYSMKYPSPGTACMTFSGSVLLTVCAIFFLRFEILISMTRDCLL